MNKIRKYQDLKTDLRTTWSLNKVELIPVVMGANGLIYKELKGYLESIPCHPSCYKVQKAAHKGTIPILKRPLGYHTIETWVTTLDFRVEVHCYLIFIWKKK